MSDTPSAPMDKLPSDMQSILTQHWKLFLIEGILLVLLGIGAIIVPPIAGLIERRGLGLTPEPHLAAAVLRLVIDCGTEPERMPEPEALVGTIAGVTLPRLSLLPRPGDERLILTALALFAGSD